MQKTSSPTISHTDGEKITLSPYAQALVQKVASIAKRSIAPDASRISVSQTVSFFAIMYEKVRNAVEFREEHLVRRAAIERILKRRLMLNPDGQGAGENLIRELLWARYLPNTSITETDVIHIQSIIDKYLYLKKQVVEGRDTPSKILYTQFIRDLLTSEIEEELAHENAQKKAAFLYFIYQVLKEKVSIRNVSDEQKDIFFYVACESGFAKNDLAFIRYHLFKLSRKTVGKCEKHELETLVATFPELVSGIERVIKNPFHVKLVKFVRKQVPPFSILFTIINRYPGLIYAILGKKDELWKKVDIICREKYKETGAKLKRAAVRSIIYIFLTKMIFVLLLEYPLTRYVYRETDIWPLAVNTFFPPILMALFISFVTVPSEKNTKNIFARILDILNRDPSFETSKTLVTNKTRTKRPLLLFGFTIFYLCTFGVTFALIYLLLDYLRFNLISKAIFMFFLTVITFFAFRIVQTTKEYTLEEKENILAPLADFFFMPILSVGKFVSSGIAKINIFILIFDFLIEAPFKMIFEIVEEWINFVKARKEDII